MAVRQKAKEDPKAAVRLVTMSNNGRTQAAAPRATLDGEVIGDEVGLRWFCAPRELTSQLSLPLELRDEEPGDERQRRGDKESPGTNFVVPDLAPH